MADYGLKMRRSKVFLAGRVFIFVIGGLRIGAIEAQDEDIKVGGMVELYDGGSAYNIRTPVLRIDKDGKLTVRYKSPFANGTTNATLPPKILETRWQTSSCTQQRI